MASAWIRQLVIQYYRRRRFLQYNFMDPGWGARISYGGQATWPPSLAPALDRRECERVLGLFPHAKFHRYPFRIIIVGLPPPQSRNRQNWQFWYKLGNPGDV